MEPDEIHMRILEELADLIPKPFLMTFKQSWEPGEVPADWKLTKAIPVFKKGKKRTMQSPGTTSVFHERKVLLVKPDFLLQQDNPSS